MGITGKYNFVGIKKQGAIGLRLALLSSPSTAWLLKFGSLSEVLLQATANWFANKGLIVLNIGAIYVNGEIDQALLDRAIDSGIKAVENAGGSQNLTPEQIKEIDDAVIAAADKALVYGKPKP
jgi:hypothetical protein